MIQITLPWPPSETSPNASGQGKWRTKASAAKAYKTRCAWQLVEQKIPRLDADAACVSVRFDPPANRAFDLDNMLARAKQGLDAIAERIGVDDAKWRELHLERGGKFPGGRIVVTITEPSEFFIIEHRGQVS